MRAVAAITVATCIDVIASRRGQRIRFFCFIPGTEHLESPENSHLAVREVKWVHFFVCGKSCFLS